MRYFITVQILNADVMSKTAIFTYHRYQAVSPSSYDQFLNIFGLYFLGNATHSVISGFNLSTIWYNAQPDESHINNNLNRA